MGWEDDRAVSEVLGAILLFGILVLAIGGYQSFVVPQQNAEVEHEHNMKVNDEFPEIQKAISNAAASGKQRTSSITLGTDYPSRTLSVSWPGVSGNLKTGREGKITLKDGDGKDIQVRENGTEFVTDTCGLEPETRSIQYRANYNELEDTGTFVYEHGVTYRHYRGIDERVVQRGDQELIVDDTIRLYPIENGEFDRTTSSSERLRFQPGKTGSRTLIVENDSEAVLELPTELQEDDHWKEIFSDEDAVINDDITVSGGTLELPLSNGTYRVQCTPVGLQRTPEQSSVPDDSSDGGFNPAGPGSVQFNSTSTEGDNNVTVSFENRDSATRTIDEARIAFYSANAISRSPSGDAGWVDFDADGSLDEKVGGPFTGIDDVEIEPGEKGDVTFGFYCADGVTEFEVDEDDFFVLGLKFDDGATSSYFIKPKGGAQNRC